MKEISEGTTQDERVGNRLSRFSMRNAYIFLLYTLWVEGVGVGKLINGLRRISAPHPELGESNSCCIIPKSPGVKGSRSKSRLGIKKLRQYFLLGKSRMEKNQGDELVVKVPEWDVLTGNLIPEEICEAAPYRDGARTTWTSLRQKVLDSSNHDLLVCSVNI
ncbi:hypothetical protein AVEN_203162-1 [Araneus ventricosus]|uniref:Uncharacterized protein n=1 Tax=Araneus ventricosus TaxID=182803 RepID=A0A4Y2CI62_ARAVE|nr:hypothetical protein AVEN_203162-1 [Araneus ventricosus]